jgi:Ca-activated chloride channel family protein
MTLIRAGTIALAFACLYPVPTPSGQVLSVYSDLVVLPARVERNGVAVAGLTADRFLVFEDGVPQTVSLFGAQDEPVTIGLLVDNSSSMYRNRQRVVEAASEFARLINPRDELFVVHFNDRIVFGLPPSVPFTSDWATIQAAIARMASLGQTALHDAIFTGLSQLDKGGMQRRVLILISDGGDNVSRRTFDEVIDRARRTDALIFSIAIIDDYSAESNLKALKDLATATGGEVWTPRRVHDVRSAFEQIAEDIRTGYTLGFASTNPSRDGKYRKIQVVVRDARGKKLSVRTRAGYLAPSALEGRP